MSSGLSSRAGISSPAFDMRAAQQARAAAPVNTATAAASGQAAAPAHAAQETCRILAVERDMRRAWPAARRVGRQQQAMRFAASSMASSACSVTLCACLEAARANAPQRTQVRAATQRLANVFGQGADVACPCCIPRSDLL